MALHHPDCEFAPMHARVEGGGPYRGRDGVRSYWVDLLSVFEDWPPVLQEVRDHGDVLIVRMRVTGRARESGMMFDETLWQTLRWRDGWPGGG